MKPERDYIGPDPVAWVDRLLIVNERSAFTADQKNTIHHALNRLGDMLHAGHAPEV